MQMRIIAFTKQGVELAKKIGYGLQQQKNNVIKVYTLEKYCNDPILLPMDKTLSKWSEEGFKEDQALIFISATGIAVRAIAPFINHKSKDPAVVVLDEKGQYVIALLSGHIGGANQLARVLAVLTGGVPIISTATDINGVFAVDEWAKRRGYCIRNPKEMKLFAATLLDGHRIRLITPFQIEGPLPKLFTQIEEGSYALEVTTHLNQTEKSLQIVPPIITLGIGCKKGTSMVAIETFILHTLKEANICIEAVGSMATIDLKKDEEGLLAVAQKYQWTLHFHSSEALMQVPGDFSKSVFVAQITKADNVCERAAVATSGGKLIVKKQCHNGVTIALAQAPFVLKWEDL